MHPIRRIIIHTLLLILVGSVFDWHAHGEDLAIDLSEAEAWVFSDENARIENGELVLDGRAEPTKAFYLPHEWGDVKVKAKFRVETQDNGVLACGFVARAKDASTYYYVHYDKGQAILCRSDENQPWIEIKRMGDLSKPAGTWHEGELQIVGDTLRVSLNGTLLYETQDAALKSGRIGFYAGQGLVHVKDIVVSGDPQKPDFGFAIPPPMFVHVTSVTGAGNYEAFPDVCRLSDGRLMCVFYAGYTHVSLPSEKLPKGGRVSYALSSDEGRTWSEAETLYDGPHDDRDPSIVQTASGRLISNFFSLQKADGKSPPWFGLGSWMVYSDDMGKTWSEAMRIADGYYCSSPVRQLSDGRLILGLYAEENGKGWGAVAISKDDGMTWSDVIDIDNNGMPLDAETDIIELIDGTLYAAQRGRGDSTAAWSQSKDGGLTWSVSEPYGFPGHCHYLHRTLDGIILMAHRLPSTSLHYSLDECKTWSENVPVDSVIGAYPSMVNLSDGTVLIVYYEEGEGSSIRAKRLRATAEGIEWLPVEQPTAAGDRLGLVINEDNSHFFTSRSADDMTLEGLHRLIDQYAGTQVSHLFLSPNSMRASFNSTTRDPIWELGSQEMPTGAGKKWMDNARLLHERGLDPYAVWIARSREKRISPWLSMRMNDIHDVPNDKSYMHSTFWVEHPEYRRVPDNVGGWNERALNFGIPEVREHAMSFVRELLERYDPDGIELDWMRFGWHFKPGEEAQGAETLTAFMREARQLTKEWSKKRGHPIKLGARVPAHPDAAKGLGMDGARWVKEGLVDMLVPTPFWTTSDFDIPLELWREHLGNTADRIVLASGLEFNIRAFPGAAPVPNTLETVRGFAAASRHRGADQIYLFNYMDSETIPVSSSDYRILVEDGLGTDVMANQPRRHVHSYRDTVPPGFPNGSFLPGDPVKGATVRLNIGSKPAAGRVIFVAGLAERVGYAQARFDVTINGEPCSALADAKNPGQFPHAARAVRFSCPLNAVKSGYNDISIQQVGERAAQQIIWAEIRVEPTD